MAYLAEKGSSPRVRGTLPSSRRNSCRRGIIPACAGNTSWPCPPSPTTRDHPRVCGEHMWRSCSRVVCPGSSPRVRGTLRVADGRGAAAGIIPACAGNTSYRYVPVASSRDHPRVCGEHAATGVSNMSTAGSSPRVRGTRHATVGRARRRGIIPACAGNTLRK